LPVRFGEGRPVRKNSVVVRQIEGAEFRRRSDSPVVCVVKENTKICPALPVLSNARDQPGRIPFMHQDKVAARQSFVQIGLIRRIRFAPKRREGMVEGFDCFRTVISQQILTAPATLRLEDANRVPARYQLGRNATQKMCVAVIPIRNERMVEQRCT
jgi:hypothetical protein